MDLQPPQSGQHAGPNGDGRDDALYLQPFTPTNLNTGFSFTAAPKMPKPLISHSSSPSSPPNHHQQQQITGVPAEQQRSKMPLMGNGTVLIS